MADYLLTGPAIIVLLGTLVCFHELGHFAMAKILGMKVEEFAFGFGPKWIRVFKLGDTEFTIHPIPLGGFVKVAGMEPGEEHMAGGFIEKPWYSRWLVLFAGPVMSFVLAYLIFCLLGLTVGLPITGDITNKVDLVRPGSVADQAHLKSGDTIVSISGNKTDNGREMLDIVHSSAYKPLVIRVRRDGREFTVHATPQSPQLAFTKLGLTVDFSMDGKAADQVTAVRVGSAAEKAGYRVGDIILSVNGRKVKSGADLYAAAQNDVNRPLMVEINRRGEIRRVTTVLKPKEIDLSKTMGLLGFAPKQRLQRVGLAQSIKLGNEATSAFVVTTAKMLFSREVKDAVSGPIAIADATLNSVRRGLYGYLQLIAILSLSLGTMNLLPIPVADGGQMTLLLIEAARRRRLSQRTMEMSQRIGLAMVAIIFGLIMYLDITRLATNKLFR